MTVSYFHKPWCVVLQKNGTAIPHRAAFVEGKSEGVGASGTLWNGTLKGSMVVIPPMLRMGLLIYCEWRIKPPEKRALCKAGHDVIYAVVVSFFLSFFSKKTTSCHIEIKLKEDELDSFCRNPDGEGVGLE